MPNPSGSNGHQNGDRPSDERLRTVLHNYASRNLSLRERLLYLEQHEGYKIGLTRLKKLNKDFEVPTARKPPPLPVSTTYVSKAVSEDIAARNGPSTIQHLIRQKDGVLIPRDTVRQIMKDNYPHGAEIRFPGKKVPRPRGQLQLGRGVFQEVHCDGHEKLNAKALRMGSISIDQYGLRCHSSGKVLHMVVLPNARCSSTIGHVYLDFVSKYGMICEQLTVDGGSETGEMYACHKALCDRYIPNPSCRSIFTALPSTQNVVIEGSWGHWLRFRGVTLRETIELGQTKGYFNANSPQHVDLFNWIWPKIVQNSIDEFVQYWNDHKTRKQQAANIPSGTSPNLIFDFPQNYGLDNCGVTVSQVDIDELRATIPRSRDECFSWVSDEFEEAASAAYIAIKSPAFLHANGWQMFVDMLSVL